MKAIFFPSLPHGFEILDLREKKKKKRPVCPRFGGVPGKQSFMLLFTQQHEDLFDAKKKLCICSSFRLLHINGVTAYKILIIFSIAQENYT